MENLGTLTGGPTSEATMKESLLRKTVTTRTVQSAITRMIGQTHGDVTAAMGHKELGQLGFNQAWGVDDAGTKRVFDLSTFGGVGTVFDPDNPPSGYSWWVPGDEWTPPSVLKSQSQSDPTTTELPVEGTEGGNGTGKLVTVWDAVRFTMKVSGRLLARVEQQLDGVPGYRGFVARHIARKVVGRAASVATATLFSNVLTEDRRVVGQHYISTRRWKFGKFVGRHCGFAAYYRPRGRPALPESEAIRRRQASEAKRRKGGKRRNYKGGHVTLYKTKTPRPSMAEWSNKSQAPVVGQAKILNHRRGKAWLDGWAEFVTDHVDKEPDEIASDIGDEASRLIKREAVDPFFRWFRKGSQDVAPSGGANTLNTPAVR